ncbi:similar to Saccharomyces cerevisiae YPR139C VPS66 Cytoplasmic protein of unknown function involved in vacuolar protein sorting [Maudiozyma barnettii]|uniref:Phospholipid/glycerol acyltransferase domain-containing protein n=1 Tax=Maudiozyma barnettii TaxID=61262 RepID=A0A8H2VIV5_9SACH|nr:lysophosphatidic acid acyltransferase LOA1 [Kazachstania barnettii]CAB4256079.1 similar to Saccharomyces cerevisiae YPR139C VPS66 Cytoplasmic protein of unknown function involved in vacuolar protein sorting [Kazachstania barnettii]CAD1784687.1 similar to Saccharomyces cerevisiae YPR139C VPS66 Cytoplasmic protein of unknown function involved in vacuolar protein sorting [Kazachstania barnettii]
MEKFTNWRDKGTGIAPFQPPTTQKEAIFFNKSIITNIIFSIIYLTRCILLVPLLVLSPFINLRLLFLTGFTSGRIKIDYQVNGIKRSQLSKDPQRYHLQKGYLYVVNYSSVLTAVVLQYVAQDNRSIKYLIPSESNDLYELTFLQFVNFTMSGQSLDVTQYGTQIKEISNKDWARYTWCLFAEGTCSNGKSILPFEIGKASLELIFDDSICTEVIPVTIKVNNSLVTPLGGSSWRLLWSLILKHKCLAKVKVHEAHSLINEMEALDGVRESLNDGDKYKLVSKSLGIVEKRKFVNEFRK